ncbi:hypothetical protein [Nocardioides sp. B-3]|uniref:hypothetical protein n=1 Tax=Nocardioides sp. B-3 TaxID=2895565 RepID=UPI003FA5D188
MVLETVGVLVLVDPDPAIEVAHGLEADVGVAEEVGEALDERRAEVLDACHAVLAAERGVGEVDVHDGLRPQGCELAAGESREPGECVGQMTRRPHRAAVVLGLSVGPFVGCRLRFFLDLGVLEQQLEQVGRSGEPAEGEGAELVAVVVVAVGGGEDVGDAVGQGVDPDGVAVEDAGDDGAVAGVVGAGQGDVAAVSFECEAGGLVVGVGLDGLGAGELEDGGGGLCGDSSGDRAVDDAHGVGVRVAGGDGDLAGDPGVRRRGRA